PGVKPPSKDRAAYARWWRKQNSERARKYGRERYRRLREQELRRLREKRRARGIGLPGLCEACGLSVEKLHRDHDHLTGIWRGKLCPSCNLALGMVQDSP